MNTSIATLRYRILDGPVSLEPLQVLQSRCIVWEGWTLSFSVLGASHAVTFAKAGAQFSEVLACASPTGPISATLDLPGCVPSEPLTLLHGVQIRGVIIPFSLDAGDDLHYPYPPGSRLDRPFPVVAGQLPVTRIGWRPDGNTLVVETVHTYPEESVGVRTKTVFSTDSASAPDKVESLPPKEGAFR